MIVFLGVVVGRYCACAFPAASSPPAAASADFTQGCFPQGATITGLQHMNYGIQGYPTKLILDPTGKIVKISVGEDPKFYEELKDLLK